MLKKYALLIVLGFLAAGCQKKHEDGTVAQTGSTIGGGVTTVSHLHGAITAAWPCGSQTCRQTVTTNADVTNFPNDAVSVFLCKNADCSVSPLPAKTCGETWQDPTAPCYTGMPSVQIVLGKNMVQFINANQTGCVDAACTVQIPGYDNYSIDTVVTR